jgi:GGDEF domain-containing protein
MLRRPDIAVRWVGEESLMVLNKCRQEEARQVAEKIRTCIKGYQQMEGD